MSTTNSTTAASTSSAARPIIINVAHTPKFPVGKAGAMTHFAFFNDGVQTPFTVKGLLAGLKGKSAVACFQYPSKLAKPSLSVNFSMRAPDTSIGLGGMGAGFRVTTAKGNVIMVRAAEAISILSGTYVEVSIASPWLVKPLDEMSGMPVVWQQGVTSNENTLPRGFTLDDVVFATTINRKLNAEPRPVRSWFNGHTGERAYIGSMGEAEAREKGFHIVEKTVYPTDLQNYSPEYILANACVAVGVQDGDSKVWFGALMLSKLAELITGVEASVPTVERRTNREFSPARRQPIRAAGRAVIASVNAVGSQDGGALPINAVHERRDDDAEIDRRAEQAEEQALIGDGEVGDLTSVVPQFNADEEVPF